MDAFLLQAKLGGTPDDAVVSEMMSEVSAGGEVSKADFISMMKRVVPADASDNLTKALMVFEDKEVKGCVDASELRHALTTLCPDLPDEKVDDLLREANVDDDGKINIANFVKVGWILHLLRAAAAKRPRTHRACSDAQLIMCCLFADGVFMRSST